MSGIAELGPCYACIPIPPTGNDDSHSREPDMPPVYRASEDDRRNPSAVTVDSDNLRWDDSAR